MQPNGDPSSDTTAAQAPGDGKGLRKAPAEAAHAAATAGTAAAVQDALVSLFLEAARTGVSAEELASSLGSVLPDARARAIAALAAEGQPSMRSAIEALSLGPDQLVDVSWQRASVAASGRELPRAGGTPLFTVTLTVRGSDGTMRPLQFTANSEELTDLVRCVVAAAAAAVSSALAACPARGRAGDSHAER
jgi:hypothetical protein